MRTRTRPTAPSVEPELDPTRMCALLVGLPDVFIVAVDAGLTGPIRVHVETTATVAFCAGCGSRAWSKDRPVVELVDLACFGRPARLVWRKRRWRCPNSWCRVGSWTEDAPGIAAARLAMTDRAGRWVTAQVGRCARSVNEVAVELGCDWHTINARRHRVWHHARRGPRSDRRSHRARARRGPVRPAREVAHPALVDPAR